MTDKSFEIHCAACGDVVDVPCEEPIMNSYTATYYSGWHDGAEHADLDYQTSIPMEVPSDD